MFNKTVNRSFHACCGFALLLAISQATLADSDLDGIEDALDNCIFHPNPLQADTDADGFGNQCDADFDNNLFVNVADLAFFRSVFGTANVHADLDTNAIVNFADLAAFKSLFGATPGPAGSSVYPLTEIDDATLVTETQVTTRCTEDNLAIHTLEGNVFVDRVSTLEPYAEPVAINWFDNLGNTGTAASEAHHYSITLEEATVGPISQVQLSADPGAGLDLLVASETLQLTRCQPVALPFDISNGPTDPDLPPVLGTEPGTPNEVDVVHLGGTPQGPTQTKIVAAAGTGAGAKLYSYTMDTSSHAPIALDESEGFAGYDIKLHALTGDIPPDFTVEPFVVALRLDDNLWLRTWQLTQNGEFIHFTGRGYGENAKEDVKAYAITHRVLANGHYQVVTPVQTALDRLRFVTWLIDSTNGDVFGRYDSNDFGLPDSSDAQLSVSHLNAGLFVVNYRDTQGILINHYWQVDDNGYPVPQGDMASGLDLRNTDSRKVNADAALSIPILTDDFVTPVFFRSSTDPDRSSLRLYTWETRLSGSIYQPSLISHSDRDTSPNENGVTLGLSPAVTGAAGAPPGVRALLADDKVGDFNATDGALFTRMPFTELDEVHMASVTKVMALLLAVEAINDGRVSLTDNVLVSQGAGDLGGSKMGRTEEGLVPGETQTLELLLHGVMQSSGNDATAAVAEHISGSVESFVSDMNSRANELGMTNTTYWVPNNPFFGPGNGGTSTPEDQVTLWRFAREIPLFLKFAKATFHYGCGTGPQGEEKCWALEKSNDPYPGMNGWKGGNGGAAINAYTVAMNGPFCIGGGGCVIAESYRMDRGLIVGLQNTGGRWTDAASLWDFGFRTQFTPDRRGFSVGAGAGVVEDFSLDGVGSTSLVTIALSASAAGEVIICTWNADFGLGSLDQDGCIDLNVSGLAASTHQAIAAGIDGALLGTTFADGDIAVGHRTSGGALLLNLWRVGNLEP